MKAIPLAIATAFLFSGCVLVHGHRAPARAVRGVDSGDRACRPNEYRDGNVCRHKGKGHGARKHDRSVD